MNSLENEINIESYRKRSPLSNLPSIDFSQLIPYLTTDVFLSNLHPSKCQLLFHFLIPPLD